MPDADVEAAIEQLNAVPLEDFVAERKRLAKDLRSDGNKAGAAEVAKLAKPTPPAWALNHVAREDPDAVARWLEAAEELREASAHAAEVGGDALRAAIAAHRTATTELATLVRDSARPGGRALSAPMIDRVRALLQSATVDPELAERLRAGRISEEDEADDLAPAFGTELPAGGTKRAAPKTAAGGGKAPQRDREAEARAKRRAELEHRIEKAADRGVRLRKAAARDAKAAEAAEERLEEARRTLHRRESEAAAARDAADDAERAAEDAERELEQLRTLLRRAGD